MTSNEITELMEEPKEIWATDLGQGYYEGTITKQYPNDIKYIRADIFEALENQLKNHNVSQNESRYTFDFEHKCGITGKMNTIECVTWAKTLDGAIDNLKKDYPNAKRIFISVEFHKR